MIIRLATLTDAGAMVALINPIIRDGGTTAHCTMFDANRMRDHYLSPPRSISCFVADDQGKLLGFQALEWADPNWADTDALPEGYAVIASFVAQNAQTRGIGQKLFEQTCHSAHAAKVLAIDATIRADNAAGLGFYSRLGFQDNTRLKDVPLSNGVKMDRIRKIYRLSA